MVRKFVENFLSKRASKFIVAVLGTAVTWVGTHGIPLDAWVTDATLQGIGGAVTAGLVWAVRNVG